MPRKIRKKSQKRFEAFLKRELDEYRKRSDMTFLRSKALLREKFPEISLREVEEIARKFENKHFHEVLGDSIRYAKKLESAKKWLPKPKRKQQGKKGE